MKRIIIGGFTLAIVTVIFAMAAFGADTDFGNARGYGWQDRERVCVAMTPEQCTAVLQLQAAGGDGGAGGDGASAGDAGTGASGGGDGGNGDGCGAK